MKKIISMVLGFALVLSLAACGQSEQDREVQQRISIIPGVGQC